MERAELGVDGNAAFALLGDLPTGEAEFVEIDSDQPVNSAEWRALADAASRQALRNLHARLPDRKFSYFLGESHPRFC